MKVPLVKAAPSSISLKYLQTSRRLSITLAKHLPRKYVIFPVVRASKDVRSLSYHRSSVPPADFLYANLYSHYAEIHLFCVLVAPLYSSCFVLTLYGFHLFLLHLSIYRTPYEVFRVNIVLLLGYEASVV